MIPDATPGIQRIGRGPFPTLHETPAPTCDETRACNWPDLPGNCYEWPLEQNHIGRAAGASHRIAPGRARRASTGADSKRISVTYSLPAGKLAPRLAALLP